MKIVLPFLIGLLAFTAGMSFFKLQSWFKLRQYRYRIKGAVDDIVINENKLFFIIKWFIPEKMRQKNPGTDLDLGVQYYNHFIKKVQNFESEQKKNEFVNNFINKHGGRDFYLKAKIQNGVIREVCAMESPGQAFVMYITLSIGLIYLINII